MNNSKTIALTGLVLASLTGASAQANPFAATALSQGYQVVAPEAACGGTASTDAKADGSAKKEHEGKCGEGKCGAKKAADGKAADAKAKEGMCGEGKCGEGKCGENMGKADAAADKSKEAKCGADHKKASQGSCGGVM